MSKKSVRSAGGRSKTRQGLPNKTIPKSYQMTGLDYNPVQRIKVDPLARAINKTLK